MGVAPYPCWATVPDTPDYNGPGDPDGVRWLPGECDVPVRNHEWFWTPDGEPKLYADDTLLEMYYHSVGRNCNLLLNANPGPDGLVPQADLRRYEELGRRIHRLDAPLAEAVGSGPTLELRLPRPQRVDHALLMEEISAGERVHQYRLEGLVGPERWQLLAEGSSIGHKRIERFTAVEVAAVRLRVLQSAAPARIRRLAVLRLS